VPSGPFPGAEAPIFALSVNVTIPTLCLLLTPASPVLVLVLADPAASPLYTSPLIPVAVDAIVIVLSPTTRTETSLASLTLVPDPGPGVGVGPGNTPRLTGTPPLSVAAAAPGARVMLPLIMMAAGMASEGFESEMMIGIEFRPRIVVAAPAVGAGVIEAEGGVGKVMLCAIKLPSELMMRTGARAGEVGFAGERVMMVSPGRVVAAEPGKIVTGGPVEGVKTIDEAPGWRVIGKLPIVAIMGAGTSDEGEAGPGADGGVKLGLEKSWMVVSGLAGWPLLTDSAGETTS
jgi:hypothetical protein